ncbi:MAG TPA: hypothetical protein DCG13_04160, partial [Legionellales bacterium]|nr:hypothetical protein [Legionellales bacterium]
GHSRLLDISCDIMQKVSRDFLMDTTLTYQEKATLHDFFAKQFKHSVDTLIARIQNEQISHPKLCQLLNFEPDKIYQPDSSVRWEFDEKITQLTDKDVPKHLRYLVEHIKLFTPQDEGTLSHSNHLSKS